MIDTPIKRQGRVVMRVPRCKSAPQQCCAGGSLELCGKQAEHGIQSGVIDCVRGFFAHHRFGVIRKTDAAFCEEFQVIGTIADPGDLLF